MRFAICGLGMVLAGTALGQNPTVAFPKNYRMLIDNPSVAVLRAHYGPHETVGVHDHSDYSTVYVYLNDSGPVRFSHAEAHPFSIVRPPTHAGALRVSPGRLERHSVENLSELPSDYLRVELKHLPVKALPAEARIPAPVPPLVAGTAEIYSKPGLRIERTICVAGKPCTLDERPAGSVVIAISGDPVQSENHGPKLTFESPAMWLAGGRPMSFSFPSSSVQLIRLEIPKPR
ncbi:MAG: hypothetical protein V4555_05520 [Acidobacteriota bacterium]